MGEGNIAFVLTVMEIYAFFEDSSSFEDKSLIHFLTIDAFIQLFCSCWLFPGVRQVGLWRERKEILSGCIE